MGLGLDEVEVSGRTSAHARWWLTDWGELFVEYVLATHKEDDDEEGEGDTGPASEEQEIFGEV